MKVVARVVTDRGEQIELPIPPRILLQMVQQLQTDRAEIDRTLEALRPIAMAELSIGNGASAAPPPKAKAKGVAAWKHRRRCQKCEQLTATDPCQHCGAEIAPAGARK